jgi:hypothetical protein
MSNEIFKPAARFHSLNMYIQYLFSSQNAPSFIR